VCCLFPSNVVEEKIGRFTVAASFRRSRKAHTHTSYFSVLDPLAADIHPASLTSDRLLSIRHAVQRLGNNAGIPVHFLPPRGGCPGIRENLLESRRCSNAAEWVLKTHLEACRGSLLGSFGTLNDLSVDAISNLRGAGREEACICEE